MIHPYVSRSHPSGLVGCLRKIAPHQGNPLPEGWWHSWAPVLVLLRTGALFRATDAERLTTRQGSPWRAYLLTVPFQAPVKSLSVDRPVDAGSTEVRCRHDLARGLAGLFERFHARRINFRRPARFASLGGQPFLIATNARSNVGRLFDDC